jgi:hypothetical protein
MIVQNRHMDNIAEIEREIRAAFPAKRALPFASIARGFGEEPLATIKSFENKDHWTNLDAKWLDDAPDGWATALSFLSDAAVCFYIPAYLIADLHGGLERAEPSFCLTYGFSDFTDNTHLNEQSTERWSHLSKAQALGIVHYLEWLVSEDKFGIHESALQALNSFWYRRASEG